MIKRVWIVNMGITLGFILLVWALDALLHMQMPEPGSESGLFSFFSSEPHEIFLHVMIAALFLLFGILTTLNTIKIKRSKAEFKEQKEHYRLLAEHSNDVIWKLDMNGKFLYVSPSVEKLRGYTPDEVLRQDMYENVTPESAKVVKELLNRFYQIIKEDPSKTPSIITELEQPRKDGSTVWTEASITTVKNHKGLPQYFLGVSRDITDRKRKELDLKRSEEYYRLLADTSLDYIMVHDLQGNILYANPSGLKASEYDPDEILGRNILDIIPPEHHGRVTDLLEKRKNGDFTTYCYEIEFISKSGKVIPVEVSAAPILINKTPISVMVSARDITERYEAARLAKKSHDRIQKINAELEDKVKERTLLLENAYEELESFSYSVSHNLRAPLRQAETFAGLLKKSLEQNDTAKSKEYMNFILNSTSKMKGLIDSLLLLSRTTRKDLRKDRFDMKLIVDEVIRDVSLEYPSKKIAWQVGDLGEVEADIRLMNQVWYNLISNSLKFSNGKEKVIIEIGQLDEETRKTWYIRDNGVGFDPRYKDKLFGVFQRLHSDMDFDGTGIGLATVKRIIERHRGKIWADSRPGDGSVFYFYLS